jgi:transcriptional regulator with XRE-family HTH domain
MIKRTGKKIEEKSCSDERGILLPGLAAHRRRKALTQRQLGERASVAHTTVQLLESGARGGYPQTIHKLAIALGVEPEDLVHG